MQPEYSFGLAVLNRWTEIVLATANRDKVAEMSLHLKSLKIKVLSINDLASYPAVEEDQPTLEGNAIKKAREFAAATGLPALADDTGLEVDFLDGAPGVFSARYAGENATYAENVTKLLREMQSVPFEQRRAQFRTVMALVFDKHVETVNGICRGYILDERRGNGGFGYDPVFFVPEMNKTFAEISLVDKNRISHRGLALQKMAALLQNRLGA